MPISDLEPLTKIKAGSYKLLPAPLKDNVFPFVLHTDTGDWKTADRDQSDTSRFPCGGQCTSTVSAASKKSGSIVTRVARGLYGVSSTQSLRYNNQNQQPVAVILTGQNTLVGLNNARDLPRKLNSEDDVRPDISLPVPSTDTVDKTDANLLVVMRAAERVVLILQIPIVTSREGRDVSTITDVVSGIVGSTKTIYVNDMRELVDPHSHAKVVLPFAQGGGSLLYLVSTVPVRLPAAYADAMSRATQQALSNLQPQLRALDSSRIPWYGYIKPPANAADATVDYIDDDAKLIQYYDAESALTPETPSEQAAAPTAAPAAPTAAPAAAPAAAPTAAPAAEEPSIMPSLFLGTGMLAFVAFAMLLFGRQREVAFFKEPQTIMATTIIGIVAFLMLASVLPHTIGVHGVAGGFIVFALFLATFADNTVREVATFKYGPIPPLVLSATLLFPLFHNSYELPPGTASLGIMMAGLVGASFVSLPTAPVGKDVIMPDVPMENPLSVVEAVAPEPATK